nr:MAG TPA: hypothetical protein [Caudoviricetes sp.]
MIGQVANAKRTSYSFSGFCVNLYLAESTISLLY